MPKTTTVLTSITIDKFCLFLSIIQWAHIVYTLLFLALFTHHNVSSLRFVYIVECINSLLLYSQETNISLYENTSTYFIVSYEWKLGYFHFRVIMNKVTINILVQVFLSAQFSFLIAITKSQGRQIYVGLYKILTQF